MIPDDLPPFFRQLRRDTYAAAIIGGLVARYGENAIDANTVFFAFERADRFVHFADEHAEGSFSE